MLYFINYRVLRLEPEMKTYYLFLDDSHPDTPNTFHFSELLAKFDIEKPKKEYLTIQELATELQVHYKSIYRAIQEGKIPALRIGSTYRINREEAIEELAVTKMVPPTATVKVPVHRTSIGFKYY